ncbi:uncharacterized protein Z520_08263 [Fonsecaea multimorphosa CBS 102226]|uniref:Xylanolytic transcriptional activator regulatory domain-containing protein n=1 Tax=Fonsecaea multimorphosa CBS 102226 TaxID=1442371 RepID=A0A0D2KH81_9EURO|nr:uncharacterized protein Z520_08263 [Fonsecaea multimorphosa CBS 102226]KIX96008.1 hypothetical protein Z520_08263 [Fonsecaea multimorphosa CBS 102226]OAL21777.1 hypothetical protein AYO22_07719 [Fonsecaea multimorphosa]
MLKPGPKPGSIRKRRYHGHPMRDDRTDRSRLRQRRTALTEDDTQSQVSGVTPPRAASARGSHQSDEAVQQHSMNVYDLISPSYEGSSPKSKGTVIGATHIVKDREDILESACCDLGVSSESMKRMVGNFFRTFTPYGLFRQSTFDVKLGQISSSLQMKALLAAIFVFGCKGSDVDAHVKALPRPERLSAAHFGDLASDYIDKALVECGDDPPSLCLLQAMILMTHWLIVKGVRGRAWRSLGLCIRIAFELGLDSVDSDVDPISSHIDLDRWCKDEERRRAFWALYEIDTFATVVKQVPHVTNWTPNRVLLPADDDRWFQGQHQQSSYLDQDFIQRPKSLQETGTESARAWYLVLISLLVEANSIHRACGRKATVSEVDPDTTTSVRNNRTTLLNCIQLYLLVVPSTLKFHGQILDFGAQKSDSNLTASQIYWQSSIYNVAILAEVGRLLALRPFIFEGYMQRLLGTTMTGRNALSAGSSDGPVPTSGLSAQELQQCFRASDAMLNVMLNCSELHYQYLNPCIAHASWLAAIVKLLQLELTGNESESRMIRSQFEILKVINTRFTQYWDMSSMPTQNLDGLATQLKQFTPIPHAVAEGERLSAGQLKYSTQSIGGQPGTSSDNASVLQVSDPQGSKSRSMYKAPSGLDAAWGSNPPWPEYFTLRKDLNHTHYSGVHNQRQQHRATSSACNTPLADTIMLLQPDRSFSTLSDLGDHELFRYSHNQILADPTILSNESTLWLESTPTPLAGSNVRRALYEVMSSGADADSGAYGLADFTYNNTDGELLNYLDGIYPGPFVG